MRALQIDSYGGPEVIVSREIPVLEPGRGEVRVRLAYSGVNFMIGSLRSQPDTRTIVQP